MDVRGIEVTNQLRSAIRAKLLELGVKYDEELPDYILVMVVNKKSRQQMHEDLHLFLEDSTTPFVDWLHDQVLKKLQKVTVAKKKATREFVPTVIVKQEEEKRKKKSVSGLDDLKVKDEPNDNKLAEKTVLNTSKSFNSEQETIQNNVTLENNDNPVGTSSNEVKSRLVSGSENTSSRWTEKNDRHGESVTNNKRSLDKDNEMIERAEKKSKSAEQLRESIDDELLNDAGDKRLKSCINKPKITSVVSVKTRLGITSSRNKFEVYRERHEMNNEYRKYEEEYKKQIDKRTERRLYEPTNRRESFKSKYNGEEVSKRFKDDVKSRSTSGNDNRTKLSNLNDSNNRLMITGVKSRLDNYSSTIKDRLGVINKSKNKEVVEDIQKNVKRRLGPIKSKFIALGRLGISSVQNKSRSKNDNSKADEAEDDNNDNNDDDNDNDDDDDDDDEELNTGPVKSHIIAIKNLSLDKNARKVVKNLKEAEKDNIEDEDEEKDNTKAIPSKVIVTPRPLKPLQPAQKRATQSLLLRAVAEANQSVVRQKNPEPSLMEKKMAPKRLKTPTSKSTSNQSLATQLNIKNRLVMENIQVELTTSENTEDQPQPCKQTTICQNTPQITSDTDDHMGVVMSLFQRGDDNQKFLVTLNGYNNNIMKDKNFSDNEEQLGMEVNEEDQRILSNSRNNNFDYLEGSSEFEEIENLVKNASHENNENHCDNITMIDEMPRKRRKLSPIVYTRSPSPEPIKGLYISPISKSEKRTLISSATTDKSTDKCRYWPNCTLGNKCAYIHPVLPCSAFPVCKFGDKCVYKHPKCKFGLSCTKLGCIFSHPPQQCKYHPFCTKPGCTYSHPQIASVVPLETGRSKFTWRRRD